MTIVNESISGGESARLVCPRCNSEKIWKNGIRKTVDGPVQRYFCKNCEKRFSEEKILNLKDLDVTRQVCDTLTGSKNLIVANDVLTTGVTDTKYEKLEGYQEYLLKIGRKQSTINGKLSTMKSLINAQVNLDNPESVQEYLVALDVTDGRKRNIANAYEDYIELHEKTWTKPCYEIQRSYPEYVPSEEILRQLIAAMPGRYPAFCQSIMETGARPVEIWETKWTDIDQENKMLSINKPAKRSNPRILPLSDQLYSMINNLDKEGPFIFKNGTLKSFSSGFYKHRKNITKKLENEDFNNINFTNMRYYYATNTYYDYLSKSEVQYRMGHKRETSTEHYINRIAFKPKKFNTVIAHTTEEEIDYSNAGFTYVKDTKEGFSLWRRLER